VRIPDAEELWRRFGAGDGSAFSQLYREHHHDVVRYCRSLLRDEQDAQDAAQGTWASLWTRPDAARRDVPLRPWLFRVAHNEAITIIRRRRPHDPLSDLDLPALDDVARDVELRDRLATLRADLVALPERQRVALLSRELGGLGHAEIAAALGISAGAAKQTIYEARRALVEAESGRSMACDAVQRALSDGDGRMRRGRRLGAHLRGCASCRTFADAVGRRRRELRLLFPAPAALGLLARVAAGMGAGGGGGSVVAASGSVATKLAATAAVVAAAGAGAQHELADPGRVDAKGPATAAPVARTASPARPVVAAIRRTAAPGSARQRPAPAASSSAEPRGATGRHRPAAGAAPATAPVEVPAAAIAAPGAGAAPRRDTPAATAPGPVRKAEAAPRPGPAAKADGAEPPGQAKRGEAAQPPGQAKRGEAVEPPGQAKRGETAEPPGQTKQGEAAEPPGQAKKTGAAVAAPPTTTPTPTPADGAAAPAPAAADVAPGRAGPTTPRGPRGR